MKNLTIVIISIIITAIYACDRLEKDVAPDLSEVPSLKNEVYTTPSTSILLDLRSQLNINDQATISVATLPQRGALQLLAEGKANYVPRADFMNGTDLIVFKIEQHASSSYRQDSVTIVIVTDTVDIPCNNGALSDYIQTALNTPVYVDVTANDGICSPGSASIKIIQHPKNGMLEPVDASNDQQSSMLYEYTPQTNFAGLDTAIYELSITDGQSVQKSVAFITFDVVACALLNTNDDNLLFYDDSARQMMVYPLRNDSLCANEVYTFEIIEGPALGTATYDPEVYDQNFSFKYEVFKEITPVLDSMRYRITSASGLSVEAKIRISIYSGKPNNGDCTIDAIDDYFEFDTDSAKISNSDSVTYYLDVLSNDSTFCEDAQDIHLTVVKQGMFGTAWIEGNKIAYKTSADTPAFTQEMLEYEACIGQVCDKATVNILFIEIW